MAPAHAYTHKHTHAQLLYLVGEVCVCVASAFIRVCLCLTTDAAHISMVFKTSVPFKRSVFTFKEAHLTPRQKRTWGRRNGGGSKRRRRRITGKNRRNGGGNVVRRRTRQQAVFLTQSHSVLLRPAGKTRLDSVSVKNKKTQPPCNSYATTPQSTSEIKAFSFSKYFVSVLKM